MEDPDTINTNLNGKRVVLHWDSIIARPFGFVNPDASFDLKGTDQKFFIDTDIESELIVGDRRSAHPVMLKELIRNLKKVILLCMMMTIKNI